MILFLSIALAASLGGNFWLLRDRSEWKHYADNLDTYAKGLEATFLPKLTEVEHRVCDACGELKSLFRSIEGRGTVCRDCEKK